MCRAPDEVAATAAASDHDGEMAAEMAQLDGPRQRTIRGRSRHDDRSGRPERIPTRSTSPQSGICAAGDLKIDRNHLRSHYRDKDLLLSKLILGLRSGDGSRRDPCDASTCCTASLRLYAMRSLGDCATIVAAKRIHLQLLASPLSQLLCGA